MDAKRVSGRERESESERQNIECRLHWRTRQTRFVVIFFCFVCARTQTMRSVQANRVWARARSLHRISLCVPSTWCTALWLHAGSRHSLIWLSSFFFASTLIRICLPSTYCERKMVCVWVKQTSTQRVRTNHLKHHHWDNECTARIYTLLMELCAKRTHRGHSNSKQIMKNYLG